MGDGDGGEGGLEGGGLKGGDMALEGRQRDVVEVQSPREGKWLPCRRKEEMKNNE